MHHPFQQATIHIHSNDLPFLQAKAGSQVRMHPDGIGCQPLVQQGGVHHQDTMIIQPVDAHHPESLVRTGSLHPWCRYHHFRAGFGSRGKLNAQPLLVIIPGAAVIQF